MKEMVSKTIPKEKKCKKAKCLSEVTLHIAEKREAKGTVERERYIQLNEESREQQGEIRKPSSAINTKKWRKTIEWETRDLFKKIRDTKGTFHAKMGSIKDGNGMDLTEAEDIKKWWQEYTEELYKTGFNDLKTTMVWSFTQSQTSWIVKSSGPQETSL